MHQRRLVLGACAVTVVALGVSGCRPAEPPTDPKRAASFTLSTIASQTGAAFTAAGNLDGNPLTQEIVTTSFAFGPPPQPPAPPGPPPPAAGSVSVHTLKKGVWSTQALFTAAEGIIGPNRPTITDVDGDGDNDVIVPAGYFFSRISNVTGSITWWERTDSGWQRHDVVTGVPGSYHGVVHVDLDGDGEKDLVTTYEDGGWPSYPFGTVPPPLQPVQKPVVRTEVFKGLGGGQFAATPTLIADGGGSLPVVHDVDADGDWDVVSTQYFLVRTAVGGPLGPAGFTDESVVWFEQKADGSFAKHVIARGLGESFQVIPVDNLDGNGGTEGPGTYGWIATNHTNPSLAPPGQTAAPQVFRLTPGADPRDPWAVSTVANGFALDDIRAGQAAPGYLSEGDLDGDGDIDLTVTGDADWSVYWLERRGDGSWTKHDIAAEYGPAPAPNYGQASAVVVDVDTDGRNEVVFSSYNSGTVVVVERAKKTGGIYPAVPHQPDELSP